MPSLTELSVLTGIRTSILKGLTQFGLEYYDDDFDVDRHHRKALSDLSRSRLTPYIIAYAVYWRENHRLENHNRYDNIVALSKMRDLPLHSTLIDIQSKQAYENTFATASFWIDRAAGKEPDAVAFERLARWIKMVIADGPEWEVGYDFLAVRLLLSVPYEDMPNYPRLIQRAINRVKFHGLLDGCYRVETDSEGKPRTVFFRAKYDL